MLAFIESYQQDAFSVFQIDTLHHKQRIFATIRTGKNITGVSELSNAPIDLWIEKLSAEDDEYQYYWHLLDENEQIKAKRFIQKKHQLQHVISHGKLRTILAGYTGIAPEKICFAHEAFGKPYIIVEDQRHEVKFNLSHSGNKMLVAVGFQEFIGVDVEVWDDRVDYVAIAQDCFAEAERLFWEALPDTEKTAFFYRFWTRKESFVKAVGAGITLGVSQVVTSINGTPRFLSIPDDYGSTRDWKLFDLNLGQGLSGALTVKSNEDIQVNLKTDRASTRYSDAEEGSDQKSCFVQSQRISHSQVA